MSNQQKRLIWAVDPFEEDSTFRTPLNQTLQVLSRRLSLPVEPTYILNLAKEHELEAPHMPHSKQYLKAAARAVARRVDSVSGVNFMKPKVLFQPNSSFSMLVRKLSEYASHSGAEAIIVGTHARTGIPRILLGSFTETLLLESHVPVITVGPKCVIRADEAAQTTPSEATLLFSTDLSQDSELIYPGVLDFAQKVGARVTLFHVSAHQIEPILQSGSYLLGGGWVGAPEIVTPEDTATQEVLQSWTQRGIDRGLRVDYTLEMKRGNIADIILKKATETQASWIAMAAESGPVRAWAIGSITRHVVRNAPCPVWILRPQTRSH